MGSSEDAYEDSDEEPDRKSDVRDAPEDQTPRRSPTELLKQPPGPGNSSQGPTSRGRRRIRAGQRSSSRRPRPVKRYLSRQYRDLLNAEIENVTGRVEQRMPALPSSQIGASYWTSQEKEALFSSLALNGPGNVCALSHAVGTKCESEIDLYVKLLQKGVTLEPSAPSSGYPSSYLDVPAAIEISKRSEAYLDSAADALAKFVEKHQVQAESERFGDDWLIDQEAAADIDQRFEADPDNLDHPLADKFELDAKPDGPVTTEQEASNMLMRPAAFLQLSRDVFMNHGTDPESNWHQLQKQDLVSDVTTEPAIFRSALEELYDIAVSITRRLVHASIFQASSRLRAKDRTDWSPVATCREADVRSAVDILGMDTDRKRYWVMAPRRYQLAVYSESRRFADGRPSTKNGFRLSHEEVEAELGLEVKSSSRSDHTVRPANFDDSDDLAYDSNLCTDDESLAPDSKHESGAADIKIEPGTARSRKRKRALSAKEFDQAEDLYTEARDKQAGLDEERRLSDLLGFVCPSDDTHDETTLPSRPTNRNSTDQVDWKTEYRAEWERAAGMPDITDFQAMESRGQERREIRKL